MPKKNQSESLNSFVDSHLNRYRRWRYKNTALLLLSMILFFYTLDSPVVQSSIVHFGKLGYLGAFVTGVFFVSSFTVAPATVVLYHLADLLHPLEVAILAGAGAVLGDYLIFRFVKDRIYRELKPIFLRLGGNNLSRFFSTPYFAWLLPILGGLIIALPLPDEVGLSIMGFSGIKTIQFIALTFLLNATGIFLIVTLARIF